MDIKDIVNSIEPADKGVFEKAKERTSNLIMPPRAVGMLNDISERLCAIHRSLKPETDKRCVFVMASDHGVVEEGVSAFPQVVTCEMIRAFVGGIATINVLARQNNARVVVCDVGTKCSFENQQLSGENEFISKKVNSGSQNFTKTAAMSRDEATLSILRGFELARDKIEQYGLNLIATGDMGIGNTTPSAAVASVILDKDPSEIAGRGTGLDDESYNRKIDVIRRGIQLNKPNRNDAIDVLAKVGGFEIGAIAGVILAAAFKRIPVVIDGFISTAGHLLLTTSTQPWPITCLPVICLRKTDTNSCLSI